MSKVLCAQHYNELIEKLVKRGNQVGNTYEFLGEKLDFGFFTTQGIIDTFFLDEEITNDFVESICTQTLKQVGPFDTSKYAFLVPAIKEAVCQLKDDCKETRRAVIQFPKEHCFQSIQLLLRENTVNIVCTMRSCNAIKNLPYDIWLCYQVADTFKYYVKEAFGFSPYPHSTLTMMIGSLHIFAEDAKHVF